MAQHERSDRWSNRFFWPGRRDRAHTFWWVVGTVLFTWGAIIVLAMLQGLALAPSPRESALFDVALHARYLLALPLLLIAPQKIGVRLEACLNQFRAQELVGPDETASFESAIERNFLAREAPIALIACACLGALYGLAYTAVFDAAIALEVGPNWHTTSVSGVPRLTLAGWWYSLVSQPVYAFAVLLLLYRTGLLWLLFWRISRLRLRINALHGDLSGGLGFLETILRPLRLPALAMSISASGSLADLILYAGARIGDFAPGIFAFALLLCFLLAGPLLLFSRQIRDARRTAILRHGPLLVGQVEWFEKSAAEPAPAATLHPEILNDANQLFYNIRATRPLILRSEIANLLLASLLPFALVASLQLPVEQILGHLRILVL